MKYNLTGTVIQLVNFVPSIHSPYRHMINDHDKGIPVLN